MATRIDHQIGNHLIMFINRAMNPVNYARDPATFSWRRIAAAVAMSSRLRR